jgi:three-Cys-motif partner protein
MKHFGGIWTETKLDAFISYVKRYLIILNKAKVKYSFRTVYFDGFAGGINNLKSNKDKSIFEFEFDSEAEKDLDIYKGSVERILNLEEPYIFDYYYFIDISQNNITSIHKTIDKIEHIDKKTIFIRQDDCNKQLKSLASAFKTKKDLAGLLFLDPFGMQINWSSIEGLKNTRTDAWILIPSGVAINRNFMRNGQIINEGRLVDFFGMESDELKDYFYYEEKTDGLFGEQSIIKKIKHPIDEIVRLYVLKMKKIWNYVTDRPLILTNSKNSPIFHFVFASNNKTGLKIANYIIEKKGYGT